MPAPTRLRARVTPRVGADAQAPPSAAARQQSRAPDQAAAPPPPSPESPRRQGLGWRLEAALRLAGAAWAIAGWLRDIWPEASPAEAVGRWLDEVA